MDSVHKKILGLDLGTTTIGWSVVEEHENRENSEIIEKRKKNTKKEKINLYLQVEILKQFTIRIIPL